MPHFSNQTLEQVIYIFVGVVILVLGYQIGRFFAGLGHAKKIAAKENDLFTAQKGFKQLYETELATLKEQVAKLTEENKTLVGKVEDYRKKAAGLGGLFNSGGKRADAMYALLLENEALEEALMTQNEKLKAERTDAVKESIRSAGYRRVLMSQLLNDERIKGYVAEIINDDKRLPGADSKSTD
jgi:cell division protein FtsB